jgi:integrase/recombinase XerD
MAVRFERGKWVIDYYPLGRKGKRVRFTLPDGSTKEDAEMILTELKKRRHNPVIFAKETKIKSLIDDFIDYKTLHLASQTIRDIKGVFKNHILPFFGDLRIIELTNTLIILYQKHRKKENGSNRSVNKELVYFSSFLKWAKQKCNLSSASEISIEPLPYRRPIPNVLTHDEAICLINNAEQPYKTFFLALYSLGLRFSEAQMLKWVEVDWAGKAIGITHKGGRQDRLPVSQWLLDELKALKVSAKSDYVFESRRQPCKHLVNVRKALARAREKAGITKKVTPHLFRHSMATNLIARNIDLRTVQEILGHRQSTTTEFYTQVAIENKRVALLSLGIDENREGSVDKLSTLETL